MTIPMFQLGSAATGVAERIVEAMHAQEQVLRGEGAWPEAVDVAAAGPVSGRGEPPHVRLPPKVVGGLCLSSAIELMWRRAGRIVFAMHPDLIAEITDTTSEQIAGTVFTRLPYTNPLVIFPEPIQTTDTDGRPCRVLGFYAYGTTAVPGDPERRLCSTHDAAIKALGIMAACENLDDAGRVRDFDLTRVSVPITGRFTVPEAVEATLAAYEVDRFSVGTTSEQTQREWITQVTRFALNVLLYLCSRTPDLEEIRTRPAKRKPAKTSKSKANGQPKPVRMIKAGWRLGPNLVRARDRLAQQRATGHGTGRKQDPQQRRCHFKTVWTGHGRTVPDIAFVLPYWTHKDLLGLDGDATVIPVNP